jgi:hypothetical protein
MAWVGLGSQPSKAKHTYGLKNQRSGPPAAIEFLPACQGPSYILHI